MKYKLFMATFFFLLLSLSYIVIYMCRNGEHQTKKSGYHQVSRRSAEDFEKIPVSQLQENAKTAVENIVNGSYSNLHSDHVRLCVQNEGDYISELHIYAIPAEELWQGDKQKALNTQMDIIRYYIKDVKEECLIDQSTDQHYDKVAEQIREGTYETHRYHNPVYENFPGMCYVTQDYSDGYMMIYPNMSYVDMQKGKFFSYRDYMINHSWWPTDVYETIKEYTINDPDIDEIYRLENADISIKAGMKMAEDYMNHQLPYKTAENTRLYTDKVLVVKTGENRYAYIFSMAREYQGIYFETRDFSGGGTNINPTYQKDFTYVVMVEKDDVDMYHGTGNTDRVEEIGEKNVEVLSAVDAVEIISESIGANSEYEISEIRLVYRKKLENSGVGTEFIGIPCWRITGKNKNDGTEINFYVNVVTGEHNSGFATDA